MSISIILSIVGFVISISLLIIALYYYRKFRYNSLKYLVICLIIFTINVFITFLPPIFSHSQNLAFFIYFDSIDEITAILALYFFLLFFETFGKDSPFTKGNVLVGSLIIIASVGLLSLSVVIDILETTTFTGISVADITILFQPNISTELFQLFIVYFFFWSLSSVLLIILNVWIVYRLRQVAKESRNKAVTKILNQMGYSILFLTIGSLAILFIEDLSMIIISIGFCIILMLYFKSGIFIFQLENIERLIIMSTAGMPLYSFYFGDELNEDIDQSFNADILFSGALQAISSLLTELTGVSQELKEIKLSEKILILYRIVEINLSVILVLDYSSQFYRDVLKEFSNKLIDEIHSIDYDQTFENKIAKRIDFLVKNSFGLRI